MAFLSATGTCVAIAETQPTTFDEAGYAALTWETIGEVTDTGEWGGEFAVVEHQNICDGIMKKAKGSFDPGQADMTLAVDPEDAGQLIVKDYYNGDKRFDSAPIRITDPWGTVDYVTAKVVSFTKSASSPDDPYTATVSLAFDREFVTVEPDTGA